MQISSRFVAFVNRIFVSQDRLSALVKDDAVILERIANLKTRVRLFTRRVKIYLRHISSEIDDTVDMIIIANLMRRMIEKMFEANDLKRYEMSV